MNTANCDFFTRLVRTRPLLLSAILFLVGCICGYVLQIPAGICVIGAAVFLLGSLFLRKKRAVCAVLLLLMFIPLGALRFSIAWNNCNQLAEQKKVQLSGRICQNPVWNADTERTICVLDEITINGNPESGRIRLYLRGDPALLQQVSLAQNVLCEAHIWEAEVSSNPGEFNFSNYLRLNGLRGYATAEIENAVFSMPSYRPVDWAERLHSVFSRRIDRLFPENAALARAFLLGDRSGLSDEERENYSNSGAAHILAVSGMHISVLAGLLSLILCRFCGKKLSFILTLLFLLSYAMLIGFSASLFRAILMFAVFSAAPLAGRYSDAITRLGGAMLVYLLVRPLAILESSFVLSYGASAGIILLYAPLTRLFHASDYLRKQTGAGFSVLFTNRLPRRILQALLITLAVQLAILPAVVHYFGTQPLWSLIVNLAAIPIAMGAFVLALSGFLTDFAPLALLSDKLFSLLTLCVRFFGSLPLTSIGIARFPVWLTLLCIAAFICTSDLSKFSQKLRSFLPFIVLPAVLISNLCSFATTAGCSIVFLDAGEADCAVIRSGHKVYLVDTGDTYSPAASYLSAMNYDPSAIFLSHPHTDHCGGLADILDVCTPEYIYISENWNTFEIDESIALALERAQEKGIRIVSLSAGNTISLSDKTLLEVLSPTAGFPANSANDDSLILRISYGNCRAVFAGDASAEMVEGKIGDIDLLKISHHGASDSLNASLLEEASPSVAVVPVGYNNYGHPDDKILKLLDAAQANVLRTDLHGAITCVLNEDGSIDVRTYFTPEAVDGLE